MNQETEWHELSESARQRFFIRAWQPGDGLYCSHRTNRAHEKCGVPVALLRTVGKSPRGHESIRTSRICKLHVASVIGKLMSETHYFNAMGITQRAQKNAREEILAKYWDELQEATARHSIALREQALNVLPASLRFVFEDIESEQFQSKQVA